MANVKKKEETKTPAKSVSAPKAPKAHAVGRRKKSIARVWVRRGSGNMAINGVDYKQYFDTTNTRDAASHPFKVVPVLSSYDVDANVCGGGKCGQADAVKLAISRAMLQFDEKLRATLRSHGLLTVDSRVKERKKYGQRGARRKFQFVKR